SVRRRLRGRTASALAMASERLCAAKVPGSCKLAARGSPNRPILISVPLPIGAWKRSISLFSAPVLNAAPRMFAALARLIYRRRWLTLAVSALALLGTIAALVRGGELTTGKIEGTEAEYVQQLTGNLAGVSGDSAQAAVLAA